MGLEIPKSCINRSQQLQRKRVMDGKWEEARRMALGWGSRRGSLWSRFARLWDPRTTRWEFPRTTCTHQGAGGVPRGEGSVSA